jgi:hypothetical protein
MSPLNLRESAVRSLKRSELQDASMWIAAKWFEQFVCGCSPADGVAELAEFGALEPNLAEAIVLDQGADFVFPRWGVALSMLCGGDHRGHRLSVLPQPSPSSRIGGFLRCRFVSDQGVRSKGLHYSACLFRYRHMHVDHLAVLVSLGPVSDSQ